MIQAFKQQVKVQADGLIQIHVPEFKAGTIAEVIVLESSEQGKKTTLTSIIGKGRGCFPTAEEADAFIRKERNSWE
jgi:hypothetical protein